MKVILNNFLLDNFRFKSMRAIYEKLTFMTLQKEQLILSKGV